MSNMLTQDEYLQIQQEFETSDDYRAFIIKYFEMKNTDVQYLLIRASWNLIVSESNQQKYVMGLHQFVRKHQNTSDDRIKALVVEAWFKKIKIEEAQFNYFELHEKFNFIAEYAQSIEIQFPEVDQVLVYIYWFKAQHTLNKDWRKAQYFYNKVISLSRGLLDEEYELYRIKAKVAKVLLHIQCGHSEHIDQLFYKILEKYHTHENIVVHLQLKKMIRIYIDHLVLEHQWFTLNKNTQQLLDLIIKSTSLKDMILNVDDGEDDAFILLLGQQYWLMNNPIYEDFLFKCFEEIIYKEDLILLINDYLIFESLKLQKQFEIMMDELYERYINLQKYRKLFKRKEK